MDNQVSFVAKVTAHRTRTKNEKDYFVFRTNIPKEAADKLSLSKNDYLFFSNVMKAKWYHMVKWEEMPLTWEMMPQQLKTEIELSGLLPYPERISIPPSVTSPTYTPSVSQQEQMLVTPVPNRPSYSRFSTGNQ